jgi:hypothetical protein
MAEFSTEEKDDGPGVPERLHEGMDIGMIFKFPFWDGDWVKKILVMGAINIIPIAGQLNAMGWMHAVYKNAASDTRELPEAGFGYIGDGVKVFVATLPFWVLQLLAVPIGGIVGSLLGLLTLGAFFLMPGMLYLYMAEDETKPWLKIDRMKDIILKPGVVPYVMLWVAFLLSGLLNIPGAIACGVGVAFTSVLGAAMQGAALAEYSLELAANVKEQAAAAEIAAQEAAEQKRAAGEARAITDPRNKPLS